MTTSYFVVMQDYGRRGREAIVDPEITYSDVVDRIRTAEYKNVLFVHHIDESGVEDVTEAALYDAGIIRFAAE